MQGGRGGGDPFFNFGDPFAGFGGFGGQRSLMSNFFGGRNPFDDPFFTRPFGGMFESNLFGPSGSPFMDPHASGLPRSESSQLNRSQGPVIEELDSDDEKEDVEGRVVKKDNPRKHGRSSKDPYVQEPDDEVEERKKKQLQHMNGCNSVKNTQSHPQARSFTFQSSSVTYGGSNGAYYTSSRTRRSGSDGLTIDERKEADSATGQAAHRISRGIHEKGHTFSRNLNSDGRVDTMQTLHNLNEDELPGFEESWKSNARQHLPGWTEGLHDHMGSSSREQNGLPSRGFQALHPSDPSNHGSKGAWALPSTEPSSYAGIMRPDGGGSRRPSRSQPGRMRADVGDRLGSSRGRTRASGVTNKTFQVGRH